MDLIKEQQLRSIVIDELTKIGGRVKGEEIQILCPFHDDSNPSLGVHIGYRITPGGFHCFACRAHGNWNDLARALRLKTFSFGIAKPTDNTDPFQILAQSLKQREILKEEKFKVQKGLEPIYPNLSWRGLPEQFLTTVGGKLFWDNKRDCEFLHFPVEMNRNYYGYTIINLNPSKPEEKYLTFADTSKCWFMYDQCQFDKSVFLVEGHLDTLRPLNLGFNVLGMFGVSAWSETKKAYLVAKRPKKVIILFDSDQAGYDAAKEIFLDLREGFDVDIHYLTEGTDPGDMDEAQINILKEKYPDALRD